MREKSPNGFKKCKRCGEIKRKEEFSSIRPICNSCKLPSQEKIYANKAEARKAYFKRHPDKLKEKYKKRNDRRFKKKPVPREGYKFCSKCKQELPLNLFYRNVSKPGGYVSQCKDCLREYKKTHKSKPKQMRNKPTSIDLEKQSCKKHRHNARKRRLAATYTYKQWCTTKEIFNHKCAYCGKEISLSQDHFIPLSKGGEYSRNNIVPVCHLCNSTKRDLDFFEWYPQQTFYSKQREQKILEYLNYKYGYQQLVI